MPDLPSEERPQRITINISLNTHKALLEELAKPGRRGKRTVSAVASDILAAWASRVHTSGRTL